MPLYYFRCEACGKEVRRLCSIDEAKNKHSCSCGNVLIRAPRPPSTSIKETLDNGLMGRRLERYSDAERLFRERAKKKD